MKFDCTHCDVIVDDQDTEDYQHHVSRGHELLEVINEGDKNKVTEKNDERNISKKIYQLAKPTIKKCIVHENDNSQVFALVENNEHVETLDLSNQKAKSWLRYFYYQHTGDNHSDDAYANAINLIKAEAIHGGANREQVFNRIAMKEDCIYYDLVTPDWKALKITKDGITVIHLGPDDPVFIRTQSQKEQVEPVFDQNNALDKLLQLLRILSQDGQLFKIHLVCIFLERFSMPIMSIVGEHGSIKSTISKSVKQIVDPSGAKTIALTTNTENLVLSLHNRYGVCFDNVSKIDQIISDILCKAITGDGNAKRKLYTDSDEVIYDYKRKIILNGISPNLEFPDLVDRNITYVTEKISEDERITEEEFEKKFNDLLPSVMGQIFQTLSKAMKIYDIVKPELKQLPRMADFAIWGECISRILGYEEFSFIDYYKTKQSLHSFDISESYPIIAIVEDLLKDRESYENDVQSFYNTIKAHAISRGMDINSKYLNFPKAPNKIKEHMTRLKPNFRNLGLEIDIAPYTKRDGKHPRNRQVIYISKIKSTILQYDEGYLPPLPSLPEDLREQIQQMFGRGTGKDKQIVSGQALPYIAKFVPVLTTDKHDKHDRDTASIEVPK